MKTTHVMTALLVLASAAGAARARSLATEDLALGHQTERADLVAVGTLRSVAPLSFDLTETIRGGVPAGASVEVLWTEDGVTPPWQAGALHLLFLARAPEGDAYVALCGPSSVIPIPADGVEARFPEIVRRLAATLPERERAGDPVARLALLLSLMEEEDPGLAWSGAVDFAAWEDLPPLLDEEGRARVLSAFVRRPAGKADKEALALAVGAARPAGAAAALLDALDPKGGTSLCGSIADALVRLADPGAPALAVERLSSVGDPAARAGLAAVLGATGGAESIAPMRERVLDESPAVRVEAAHALGRIARRVREAKPGAVVAGRSDLVGLLAAATSGNERTAALWALAQLDDPAAFSLLRRLAEDDPREFVRRHAKLYLTRPRISLILD